MHLKNADRSGLRTQTPWGPWIYGTCKII